MVEAQIYGFAQRLRLLRKEKKLTQVGLARKVGVHYNHLGRYEHEKSNPSVKTLARLASALDVSIDYLLSGSIREPASSSPSGAAGEALFEDRDLNIIFEDIQTLNPYDRITLKKLIIDFIEIKKRTGSSRFGRADIVSDSGSDCSI